MTNETAAAGGVMYADEDPYTLDVRHLCLASIAKFCDSRLRKTLKRWCGRLEKRRMATESGGDETGDETGGLGDEIGDKKDGGDGW